QTAEVCDVFTECELPVDVHIIERYVLIILLLNELCPRRVVLVIGLSPPVLQVALRIERGPFVIEAMSQLMPNDRTHGSIVRGIIRSGIKERRLKNARRKNDLIKACIVVGIHGWR